MPLLKSSKKALRSSKRKEQKNAIQKKKLRDIVRDANEKNINEVFSAIDKAVKNGIIHKNKAAHMKSALAKKIGKTPQEKKVPSTKKQISNKSK